MQHFSVKASIKVLNKRLFYSMWLPISGQVENHQPLSLPLSLLPSLCLSPLNRQLTILTSSSDFRSILLSLATCLYLDKSIFWLLPVLLSFYYLNKPKKFQQFRCKLGDWGRGVSSESTGVLHTYPRPHSVPRFHWTITLYNKEIKPWAFGVGALTPRP